MVGALSAAFLARRPVRAGGPRAGAGTPSPSRPSKTATAPDYQHLALSDPLTGLPNRRAFMAELAHRLAAPRAYSLALIDLDGFKSVNDTDGHAAGDRALRGAAEALQAIPTPGKALARLGGDEFVVCVPLRHEASLVGQLREAMGAAGLSASIGIARAPHQARSSEDLLALADAAMFEAKRAGGDRVVVAEAQALAPERQTAALAAALPGALSRQDVTVHLTPQVAAGTGKALGFTLAPHWHHAKLGPVAPEDLLMAANRSACLPALLDALLDPLLREAANWRERPDIVLTLPASLANRPQTRRCLADTLKRTGFAPARLVIAIPEPSLTRLRDRSGLAALQNLGLGLALSEVGAQATRLGNLTAAPFDRIHLCERLAADPTDAKAKGTLAALLAFAATTGAATLATGVSSAAQRRALLVAGCTRMEGPLFSGPVSPARAIHRHRLDTSAELQDLSLTPAPGHASVRH